jgi:tRNA (guanine37-N1)-methyltransferase
MKFDILTLIPDFFDSPLKQSILGRAIREGSLKVETHNIRDYTTDKHSTTDDTPYGGGPGMVMKAEPIVKGIEALRAKGSKEGLGKTKVILMTPQGRVLTQAVGAELAALDRIIVVCGRYEGVDERVRAFVDMELSIGDYVLAGGESAAIVLLEVVSRLVPGIIEAESIELDSFSDLLLEYPQYTKPREFRGMPVPEVLTSGDHGKIEKWRKDKRLERTLKRRPDLVNKDS